MHDVDQKVCWFVLGSVDWSVLFGYGVLRTYPFWRWLWGHLVFF